MPKASSSSVRVFYPRFSRDDLVALFSQRVTALGAALPLRRVVLFGSYASGRQTAASDIDVLVVYAGRPRDDAHALVKRTLSIRGLEPHVYSEVEYTQVSSTVERMARDGILIPLG